MDLARLPDPNSLGLATLCMYTVCRRCDVKPVGKHFVPPERCVGKGNRFRFNYKIMIKVQESSPSIIVTRNLWFMTV